MNRSPSQSNEPVVAEFQMASSGELPLRAVALHEPEAAQVYDCWNTIGVGGNGSCRELPRFVHCRNCPVYSAAALQLLDRPVTDEYRREWSEHYAREKKLTTPAKTSVMIFRIGSEWLALPTQAFQEVAERRAVHSLPHRRRGVVLGLVNVRGELLICASLGRLLGLTEQGAGKVRSAKCQVSGSLTPDTAHLAPLLADRLLVANWDGNRIAFPVDEVHGIQRVHQDELREPPGTVAKSTHTYSRGVFAWRDRTIGFLDADVLFAALNRSLS